MLSLESHTSDKVVFGPNGTCTREGRDYISEKNLEIRKSRFFFDRSYFLRKGRAEMMKGDRGRRGKEFMYS